MGFFIMGLVIFDVRALPAEGDDLQEIFDFYVMEKKQMSGFSVPKRDLKGWVPRTLWTIPYSLLVSQPDAPCCKGLLDWLPHYSRQFVLSSEQLAKQ